VKLSRQRLAVVHGLSVIRKAEVLRRFDEVKSRRLV
jgi:hypothetical protein